MSGPLADSFKYVVDSFSSETKTLRCLSNLRGVTVNNSSEVSAKIEEISTIVNRLEQKFVDMEEFVDGEISCLELLNDLFEKTTQQNAAIISLTQEG